MAGWQYFALASWVRVELDWSDNAESDFAYYRVYRSTTSGSGYTLLADNITASAYTDYSIDTTTTYYYVVRAVDTNGNESASSLEVNTAGGAATPIILVGMIGIRGES